MTFSMRISPKLATSLFVAVLVLSACTKKEDDMVLPGTLKSTGEKAPDELNAHWITGATNQGRDVPSATHALRSGEGDVLTGDGSGSGDGGGISDDGNDEADHERTKKPH
jgi:hypothetical protein